MNASPSHTRRPVAPRAPGRWCALAACALLWGTTGALAQGSGTPAPAGIYTCIDAHGRRLTSDRPIPACIDREQRELNRDGTVRRIIPPTLTATEREDTVGIVECPGDHVALTRAEGRLALVDEDVRHALAGLRFDQLVAVAEGDAPASRETATHRGLARTRGAHEHHRGHEKAR